MNTTLSPLSTLTTVHPPDTGAHDLVRIPGHEELRSLSLADRLSLRIGLWLLRRAQRPSKHRPRSSAPAAPLFVHDRHLDPRESAMVLGYHFQTRLH